MSRHCHCGLSIESETVESCPRCGRVLDPTPEQLRQRCLEVQAGWSADMRATRCVPHTPLHWQPPTVRVARPEATTDE